MENWDSIESIGVKEIDPWHLIDNQPLVRELFYFDKLVYTFPGKEILENMFHNLPDGDKKFEQKISEIEQLEKFGLIKEYNKNNISEDQKKFGNDHIYKLTLENLKLTQGFTTKEKNYKDILQDFFERFREVSQMNARINSIILNNKEKNIYTPIIKDQYHSSKIESNYYNDTVLNVLLRKFPVPSSQFNLEKFLEFKSDPLTKVKLLRLKDWAIEISKKNYSEKEIEQKIEYLLHEYTTQFELYKIKYKMGTIETLVTASLEVLENIATLKFSKAAKVLFDLSKQEVNLLESEQKLTGREIAYIHKAHNTFK